MFIVDHVARESWELADRITNNPLMEIQQPLFATATVELTYCLIQKIGVNQ